MENLNKVPVKETIEGISIKTEKVKTDDYTATIVEDYDGKIDPFFLPKKDPNYAYRFLRADDKNLSLKTGNLLFQKGGWQICPRKHLEKIGIKESFISKDKLAPDGMCRRGDTVLAFMPKELFLKKEAYKEKEASAPVDAIERMIKKGDDSVRGVGHKDMRGLQTQKQMGM